MKEILLIILGFGFLIFVHELGHFLVAKWVGIRCPQFAIGFGHAICSFRKGIGFRIGGTEKEFQTLAIKQLRADGVKPLGVKEKEEKDDDEEDDGLGDLDLGPEFEDDSDRYYTAEQVYEATDKMGLSETEYRLNYLPLGGYVKMLGQEDIDPNAKSTDPRAYNNKPIWARACVISAGVVMNMIFGALFLTAAFMIGVDFPSASVGYVVPGMPAAKAYAQGHEGDLQYLGLRTGDVVTAVNNEPPEDFKDVVIATALGSRSQDVELTVARRGDLSNQLTYVLTPERQQDGEKLLSVGFNSGPGMEIAYNRESDDPVAQWINGRIKILPASQRGHDTAIRMSAADGDPIAHYGELLMAFDNANGQPVTITLSDPSAQGETFDTEVASAPTLVRYPEGPANLLGLVPAGQIVVVAPDSPAEELGIKPGDVVVRLGSLDWPVNTQQVAELLVETKKDPLAVVVIRDGRTLDLGEITPNGKGKLGISITYAFDSTVVAQVVAGSPADAALNATDRFMPGTQLTHIHGVRVDDWRDIQRTLVALADDETRPADLTMGYRVPGDSAADDAVTLTLTGKHYADLHAAGWEPAFEEFSPLLEQTTLKADGVVDAFTIGLDKTKDFVLQTYITLLRLIQGNVKLYNLRGPVGIVHVGTTVAAQGMPYLLFFLGLISVNLAVINFLPIPIVDGGHMVFLAIEKITGSPPSPQVQTIALYLGLAVIGFVFVMTLFYDVTRLITGG